MVVFFSNKIYLRFPKTDVCYEFKIYNIEVYIVKSTCMYVPINVNILICKRTLTFSGRKTDAQSLH